MQIHNNTQVKSDRSNSSRSGSSVSDNTSRSALDRIRSKPTTSEYLASGLTTAEELSDPTAESGALPDKEQSGTIDAVAPLGPLDFGSLTDSIASILAAPIVKIQGRIEELEAKLETASSNLEYNYIEYQLDVARGELTAESLRIIENELMRRNNTPRPDTDARREAVGTGQLSRTDLEAMAAGGENDPVAIAARTILNEPSGFESIAGEGITIPVIGFNGTLTIPAFLTLNEIQAARLDAERDIGNATETNDGDSDYQVPTGDDAAINSTADEVEIGQVAFDAQQDAIEESIRTGEEVEFVNSVGNSVGVTVTSIPGTTTASYSVEVREGSETDTFTVNSEIGTENTIAGIANIVDWGSSLETAGPDVPAYPGTVNFRQESDPRRGASASGSINTIDFYDGTANLTKTTYIHEMGHIIGYALNDANTEDHRFSPAGWGEVLDGAAGDVSEYRVTSAEEFSEALAAYVNAADHGPEALAEFREAFPDRAAYIENKILGNQEQVVVPEETITPVIPTLPIFTRGAVS